MKTICSTIVCSSIWFHSFFDTWKCYKTNSAHFHQVAIAKNPSINDVRNKELKKKFFKFIHNEDKNILLCHICAHYMFTRSDNITKFRIIEKHDFKYYFAFFVCCGRIVFQVEDAWSCLEFLFCLAFREDSSNYLLVCVMVSEWILI